MGVIAHIRTVHLVIGAQRRGIGDDTMHQRTGVLLMPYTSEASTPLSDDRYGISDAYYWSINLWSSSAESPDGSRSQCETIRLVIGRNHN